MSFPIKFNLVPFSKDYFQINPKEKTELLQFYCNLWMYDPNFAEYRRCPICHRFYSQNDVEKNGIRTCSGILNNHPETTLELGWTPEMVSKDLDPMLDLGQNFYGLTAQVPPKNRVVGFVWGYIIDSDVIYSNWNPEIVDSLRSKISSPKIAYFQEIGSDPAMRHQGIGSALCKSLITWMKTYAPDLPGMLHTHEKSPAFQLFSKSGFHFFAKTDQVNSGRILMITPQCSQLTPENL